MVRQIKIILTETEALALTTAAGNSLDCEDDGMQLLGSRARYEAGIRAIGKLNRAIGEAGFRRDM